MKYKSVFDVGLKSAWINRTNNLATKLGRFTHPYNGEVFKDNLETDRDLMKFDLGWDLTEPCYISVDGLNEKVIHADDKQEAIIL